MAESPIPPNSLFKISEPPAALKLAYDGVLLAVVLAACFFLLNPSATRLWAEQLSVGMHAGIFGGPVFDLIMLCVLCNLSGKAIAKLGLPPLAGMLLMGFVLRQATCILHPCPLPRPVRHLHLQSNQ